MSLASFICFGIFLFLVITLFMKETDVFSPARLFIIIWSLAIGLTDLKLSRYQIQWTTFSWIMIVISLLSILIGMFIAYVINIDKPIQKINSVRKIIKNSSFNSTRLFRYIIILFWGYIISYIISALVIGYIPLFTRFPGVARIDWGIFGFGLLIQLFPSIIYFIVLYFVITKRESNKKITLIFIFTTTLVTYAILLQRYYLLFAILLSVVSIYYLTDALRIKNTFIIFFIIIIALFSLQFVRFTGAISNYLYYLSDMKYNIKYAFLTEPYMYVVMNLENLANAIQKLDNFSYGTYSFDFVFALAGIKHSLIEYLNLREYPNIISKNYNTYTMLFVYYRDFGILGLGLIPFILGFVFSTAYYKMRKTPNLNTISIYAIFVFVILFSFFVPIITFLHFAANLTLIYFVTNRILIPDLKKA